MEKCKNCVFGIKYIEDNEIYYWYEKDEQIYLEPYVVFKYCPECGNKNF